LNNVTAQYLDTLAVKPVGAISDIDESAWRSLAPAGEPFLDYRFLLALEQSGCVSAKTGWQPNHLLLLSGDRCVGIIPGYLKSHSRGEYVFDWAWADAWNRYGLEYYPKLLTAIPFSPCTGQRLLLSDEARQSLTPAALHAILQQSAIAAGAHSWHLLFPVDQDQALLDTADSLHRLGCQYHWFNHGYSSMDDFMARLTSRKRKNMRKERQQVEAQGIDFQWFEGPDLTSDLVQMFYTFYQATYLKRGQYPYLNLNFFQQIRDTMPEHLRILFARRNGQWIAAALFLTGHDTLYGRYWGCLDEYAHLHFETCYYRGIELAIDKGFRRFDAGAQGEHKLVRGFEPVLTHSWHWTDQPGFQPALENFCAEEAQEIRHYQIAAREALPYRNEDG